MTDIRGVTRVKNKFAQGFCALFTSCLEVEYTTTGDACTCHARWVHSRGRKHISQSFKPAVALMHAG